MAGHSQFANIKRKKEKEDSKRGKIFTVLAKEITIGVKIGGKDPNFNPRLRLAIAKAKSSNMPKENIDKAIKKGSGELEGGNLTEVRYEGYGPGGVAVIVDALTDNKNRTASEVRYAFAKFGGALGEAGSVSWNFDKFGIIEIEKDQIDEEKLMVLAIEAGATDVMIDEIYLVLTKPEDLYEVNDKINLGKAHIGMIPRDFVKVEDAETVESLEKMLNHIDNLDDVQESYNNWE